MSTNENEAIIHNAEAIIERFGGIRPMASKMSVPVTTVQGWKKRNVIPATRLEQIKVAAQNHNIEITDILSLAPATVTGTLKDTPSSANQNRVHEDRDGDHVGAGVHRPHVISVQGPGNVPPIVYENLAERVTRAEQRAVIKSTAINVVFLLVTAAAVVLLLWPEAKRMAPDGSRLQTIEQDLNQLQSTLADVQGQIPQAAVPTPDTPNTPNTQTPVDQAAVDMNSVPPQPVPQPYLFGSENAPAPAAPETASVNAPMFAQTPDMAARFKAFQATPEGQDQLMQGWEAISNYMGAYQGQVDAAAAQGVPGAQDPGAMAAMLESGLEALRAQNPALGKIFEGIPAGGLRQAASALGFSQLSSILEMNGTPFEMDLRVVRTLIGNDYPELAAALDGMASYAVNGALTPVALTGELAGLSSEIVSASLKGESVPVADKVMAHLNNYVQVEKAGSLITGTQTQAAVARMQQALQQGDVSAAVQAAQSLSGPAADVVAPWLNQAQVTMKAQQLKTMLNQALQSAGGGGAQRGYTTMDAPFLGGGANPYSRQ